MPHPKRVFILPVLLSLTLTGLMNPGIGAEPSGPVMPPRVKDADHFVTVSFWRTTDCSGEPVASNSFPADYGDQRCYSWPGRSGTNSATRFQCGPNSFTYTQWTTLTCSGGMIPSGKVKTSHTDQCTQDVPPTLYARITDFSGCAALQ